MLLACGQQQCCGPGFLEPCLPGGCECGAAVLPPCAPGSHADWKTLELTERGSAGDQRSAVSEVQQSRMADWDDDDFEAAAPKTVAKVTDKWDGEDEDDDIKVGLLLG